MSLPSKPSELIRVALADLRAAEENPRYRVSMNYGWHLHYGSQCSVCLAGAVMAGSLKADPTVDLAPSSFPEDGVREKLRALDAMRFGAIPYAVSLMPGYEAVRLDPTWAGRIAPYDPKHPAAFHATMAAMADRLEEAML